MVDCGWQVVATEHVSFAVAGWVVVGNSEENATLMIIMIIMLLVTVSLVVVELEKLISIRAIVK